MEGNFLLKDLSQIDKVSEQILEFLGQPKVVLLHGDMGAGKTTLVNSICQKLGVIDDISSPTFSIVNEYRTDDGQLIYHMDLYRLESLNELRGIGFSDYVSGGKWCFIEWPELAGPLLQEFALIKISVDDGARNISILT